MVVRYLGNRVVAVLFELARLVDGPDLQQRGHHHTRSSPEDPKRIRTTSASRSGSSASIDSMSSLSVLLPYTSSEAARSSSTASFMVDSPSSEPIGMSSEFAERDTSSISSTRATDSPSSAASSAVVGSRLCSSWRSAAVLFSLVSCSIIFTGSLRRGGGGRRREGRDRYAVALEELRNWTVPSLATFCPRALAPVDAALAAPTPARPPPLRAVRRAWLTRAVRPGAAEGEDTRWSSEGPVGITDSCCGDRATRAEASRSALDGPAWESSSSCWSAASSAAPGMWRFLLLRTSAERGAFVILPVGRKISNQRVAHIARRAKTAVIDLVRRVTGGQTWSGAHLCVRRAE
ncbi:hypothetical protein TSOC_008014 [Tetrabaena socialis]|uniref:Uncharacterized protein n=1 Tax=Tetrabaena socialis TaxID=47790 RepID=A0A2J7ZZL6_9CHLO|nr:hypothetical protein TSOC_008014 [Tetrabaena socialis]|eukprot:PNH05712.1 hypothetical protein TSOC_008014 [Tetrabaena socialis]